MDENGEENSMDEKLEREKISYEQNCQSIRSLNQIMWQIPLIAMTLTGGLWYGVVTTNLPKIGIYALLLLAGFGNFILIFVLWRVRNVMRAYLDKSAEFYPASYPDASSKRQIPFFKDKVVVKLFSLLLFTTSSMSFVGAFILTTNDKDSDKIIANCLEKEIYTTRIQGGERMISRERQVPCQ